MHEALTQSSPQVVKRIDKMSKDDQEHYQKLQEFRTEIKQNIEKDPKAAQIKISREIIQRTRALTEFMKPKDKYQI